ncbi:MAG: ABC transporter permease subunit [Bauldia sp.]|nr:ABC transporter permease subunit [Bauldia sp.]
MPDWLANLVGPDATFWLAYLTNGAHQAFYASFSYTLAAAVFGGMFAILFGLGGAAFRRSRFLPVRAVGAGYALIVRGVPDVLFLLFFPLAFEQAVEWVIAQGVCTPENAGTGAWPPCPDANIFFSTGGYLAIACVALGIVYGAFASSAIHGALDSVPKGQVEAARAFGMSERQIFWRIRIRQMWIYALPGLSNVWMLLVKATSLLSLLNIPDIVNWAGRLGAPNYFPRAGLVHPDWRWKYYLALVVFYLVLTWASERFFRWLKRKAGHGLITDDAVAA